MDTDMFMLDYAVHLFYIVFLYFHIILYPLACTDLSIFWSTDKISLQDDL